VFAASLPAAVQMLSAVCEGGALRVPVAARMLWGAHCSLSRRWSCPGDCTTIVICFIPQELLQIEVCARRLWGVAGLVPSDPARIWDGLFFVCFSSYLSASRFPIFPSHKLLREQKQKRSWCTRSCCGVPWTTSPAEVRMLPTWLEEWCASCRLWEEPGVRELVTSQRQMLCYSFWPWRCWIEKGWKWGI